MQKEIPMAGAYEGSGVAVLEASPETLVDPELQAAVEEALAGVDEAAKIGVLSVPEKLGDTERDQKGPQGVDGLRRHYHS